MRLGVKPYACSMCDMRFFQRYHLARHSLTHTGMLELFVQLLFVPFQYETFLYKNLHIIPKNGQPLFIQ